MRRPHISEKRRAPHSRHAQTKTPDPQSQYLYSNSTLHPHLGSWPSGHRICYFAETMAGRRSGVGRSRKQLGDAETTIFSELRNFPPA